MFITAPIRLYSDFLSDTTYRKIPYFTLRNKIRKYQGWTWFSPKEKQTFFGPTLVLRMVNGNVFVLPSNSCGSRNKRDGHYQQQPGRI